MAQLQVSYNKDGSSLTIECTCEKAAFRTLVLIRKDNEGYPVIASPALLQTVAGYKALWDGAPITMYKASSPGSFKMTQASKEDLNNDTDGFKFSLVGDIDKKSNYYVKIVQGSERKTGSGLAFGHMDYSEELFIPGEPVFFWNNEEFISNVPIGANGRVVVDNPDGSGSKQAGMGAGDYEQAFWAGKAYTDADGSLNAPFHVGHDGKMAATSLTFPLSNGGMWKDARYTAPIVRPVNYYGDSWQPILAIPMEGTDKTWCIGVSGHDKALRIVLTSDINNGQSGQVTIPFEIFGTSFNLLDLYNKVYGSS